MVDEQEKRIVVIGCNFAGYAGALELRARLRSHHHITVVARKPLFVYTPSLVLVPFGLRRPEEIAFDVRQVFARRSIDFVEGSATAFDPAERRVITDTGAIPYDYLLIATGPEGDPASIPGLADAGTYGIWSLDEALRAREGWSAFLDQPGPAVVGATQGALPLAAPYEFVLNAELQLREKNISGNQAHLTFLTPAKHLARFGAGGFADAELLCERAFHHLGIEYRTSATIREVRRDAVLLGTEELLPSRFTMLIPPFIGSGAVRRTPGLGDEQGFIEVDGMCRHLRYPEIFAAGMAVRFPSEQTSFVVGGMPNTIYPSERMAKTAARNIAATILGHPSEQLPFDELAGLSRHDMGSLQQDLGDIIAGRHAFESISPTPRGRATREALEHFYLEARRRGEV